MPRTFTPSPCHLVTLSLLFSLLAFLPACTPRPIAARQQQAESQPPQVTPEGEPLVRVRLLAQQTRLTLSASENPTLTTDAGKRQLSLNPGDVYALTLSPAGWAIGSTPLGAGRLVIAPATDGTVAISNKRYRGTFELIPISAGAFDVVNAVPVEAYLRSVITRELLPKWDPEAYKAQAIAARTYAIYEARTAPPGQTWNLYPDTRSQVYGGIADENPKGNDAVDATRGVVLAQGEPGHERIFKTYFSACCGGTSQDCSAVFGFDNPVLRARSNGSLCSASTRYAWSATVSKDDLTTRLRRWGASTGRSEQYMTRVAHVDVLGTNALGRPTWFQVTDASGKRYALTCEDFRHAVNTAPKTTLYSSFLRITNGATSITFHGRGSGHGVGLCQWCCQSLALQGTPHDQIVLQNYPGAVLIHAY